MQVTLVDPAGDDLATIAAFIAARNGDDAQTPSARACTSVSASSAVA